MLLIILIQFLAFCNQFADNAFHVILLLLGHCFFITKTANYASTIQHILKWLILGINNLSKTDLSNINKLIFYFRAFLSSKELNIFLIFN